jgi:OOP family OmpA-OmpF porin
MSKKRRLLGACFALAIPATAQAGPFDGFMVGIFDTDSGFNLDTSGIVFMNTLNDGYMGLSDSRTGGFDLHDGEHFNGKARTAARRSMVPMDEVTDRELTESDHAALSQAYLRLRRAFVRGAKEVAPVDTGYAQVAYDCWIEAAEAGRTDDAERCRAEFMDRMARIEELANYGLREASLTPPAEPVEPERYMVYFQFDSTVMTQAGRESLERAIRDALSDPNTTVKLVGHADTSGPDGYNQRLSERRTDTVRQEMLTAGIDASRFMADSVGEGMPLVPTGDGVRNPFNRVVEIDLY